MDRVVFGIFDVSIEVTCHEDIPLKRIFPSLDAMPRGEAGGKVWYLDVQSIGSQSQIGFLKPSTARTLFMWPGIEIHWAEEDPGGLYRASIPGASLTLDYINRTASLSFLKNGLPAAERLGRLAYTEILRYEKRYMVHAGAIEINGRALLILGPSGSGKSTMATGLTSLGIGRFMAEDRCLLFETDSGLMVSGVSDFLMLSAQSRQLLLESGVPLSDSLEQVKGKDAYNCHDVFINISEQACPVMASLMLSLEATDPDLITPDAITPEALTPMDQMAASKQILESGYYTGPTRIVGSHFETMLKLASDYPAFSVPYRLHFSKLNDQLKSVLAAPNRACLAPQRHRQQRSVHFPGDTKNRIFENFISILSFSPRKPASGQLSPSQWWTLLKLADHHGSLPQIAKTLLYSEKKRPNLPPYLVNSLEMSLEAAQKSRQAYMTFFCRVALVLNDLKGKWCVVYGPSIAERFCRNPETRPFHQAHILTSSGQMQAVIERLENERLPSRQFISQTMSVRYAGSERPRIDSYAPWQVVVHDRLDSLCCFDPVDALNVDGLLANLTTIETPAGSFPAPSAADQALLSLLVSVEWPTWHTLTQIQDVAGIIQSLSSPTLSNSELSRQLRLLPNKGMIAVLISLARDIFSPLFPDSLKGAFGLNSNALKAYRRDNLVCAVMTPWEVASYRYLEGLASTSR